MVRRHGWAGAPPADEQEARTRIIETAMRCVEEGDPAQFTLSDVATKLGVTRQTVYRYFPGTDELFFAVGHMANQAFVDDLTRHLGDITDPAEWVVEALATTIEWLPTRRHLTLLLVTGRGDSFTRTFTSDVALEVGRELLERSAVDWAAAGYDDRPARGAHRAHAASVPVHGGRPAEPTTTWDQTCAASSGGGSPRRSNPPRAPRNPWRPVDDHLPAR